MDIIKVNECLCHWYRPPSKGTFDNSEIGVAEREPTPQSVSLKEALKAQVAAYTKAIEKTTLAAAETATAEGAAAKSVVIKSDNSDDEGDDEDIYAAFKAVEVEDKVIKEAA
jgi:hypothetical protein